MSVNCDKVGINNRVSNCPLPTKRLESHYVTVFIELNQFWCEVCLLTFEVNQSALQPTKTVIAMNTYNAYQARFDFIEALSLEFVIKTGCGIYVYLNPVDINELFNQFQSQGVSIRAFARRVIRELLG